MSFVDATQYVRVDDESARSIGQTCWGVVRGESSFARTASSASLSLSRRCLLVARLSGSVVPPESPAAASAVATSFIIASIGRSSSASRFSIVAAVSVLKRPLADLTHVASKATVPSRTSPILIAILQTCLNSDLSGALLSEKNSASLLWSGVWPSASQIKSMLCRHAYSRNRLVRIRRIMP